MKRSDVPWEWLRLANKGYGPKRIARELYGDETRAKEIHRALMGANAYGMR